MRTTEPGLPFVLTLQLMVEGAMAVSPVTPVTPAVTPLQAQVLRRYGLALCCDAARGRYVVAARPLAAGEVALANQPYVTLAKAGVPLQKRCSLGAYTHIFCACVFVYFEYFSHI